MKIIRTLLVIAVSLSLVTCKKEKIGMAPEGISSVNAFLAQHAVKTQKYTISADAGGSFTTAQGTTVIIPANAFTDQQNSPVTGSVTVEFRDIYKKSDMLFSRVYPMHAGGGPLKSGGEFFIKVMQGQNGLHVAPGKKIIVSQPAALTGGVDNANPMQAFAGIDTMGWGAGVPGMGSGAWSPSYTDTVYTNASTYVYNLYTFNTPADSGTWCNSDNSTYFAGYTQTQFRMICDDSSAVDGVQVFLLFNTVNSMVHVYPDPGTIGNHTYYYAPTGLSCTVVAVGTKNGALYSSFVPVTISANQTVHFSMHATTGQQFVDDLEALN